MPRGLNRTDLNSTGTSYRDGTPVTTPHEFGNPITTPHNFGNTVDWTPDPAHFGNPVTLPHDFGNDIGGSTPPPPQVPALIATVTKSGQQPNPPSTPITSDAIDTTGATILVLAITNATTSNTPVVTDSLGNTWTACPNIAGDAFYPWMFYAVNPTVGAGHTFSVNMGAAFAQMVFSVLAFSGVATTSPFETQVVAASHTQSGDVVPADTNDLIIATVSGDNGFAAATITIDGDFTNEPASTGQGTNGANLGIAFLVSPDGAATNPTWSGLSAGSRGAFAAQAVFAHA